ncbi:carbon-nitrogen hydrolase family protein [Hymenobacter sp. HSC-4F20]|uniref:carbon-nitrogen hydrolase family protein n=1 Tax=Hymenobacter sp. HSC-4F20 TaxID=2864135 RepID=UPI001C73B9BC|nr:carbon-nitrogen hydrolase family protein [Hymenobacter sp. HSC-4F20]MBX0288888.1 carbon-nitrogen hydrolase family protein [Hymenobacter sp. HSC-4F20]
MTSQRSAYPFLLRFLSYFITGLLLRLAVGLQPVWWAAWLAPALLLGLAFRTPAGSVRWLVALAALVGVSTNFSYYQLVMPGPAAVAVVLAQNLLWTFIVTTTRRLVVRYQAGWTVLVYPVLWVMLDTLMAALLPDGNWGSLAYSQAAQLPLLQLTSLCGVAGLLFLVALVPAALAVAGTYGWRLRGAASVYATTALLLIAALSFGVWRLQRPLTGPTTTFGLVAIDDAIGFRASVAYGANIRRQYEQHVATLAAQGAQVVVLPEKLAVLPPAQARQWQQQFGALAARHHVWLEVGVGTDDGQQRRNLLWLFTPAGQLSASYQKHYLAPPEREFSAGRAYDVRLIKGQPYGLAICKDMHFAALGRAYGLRRAAVLLVPAWDFTLDGWLASRMTATRGVENGYTVVRAAREGWLTVSDAYGRVLAQQVSHSLPGSTLLVSVPVAAPVATLYTRVGNVLGWLCVAGGTGFLLLSLRARRSPDRYIVTSAA